MLFEMNEKRGQMLVQVMIAFTLALLPLLIGIFPTPADLYVLFTAYCLTLICRLKTVKRIETTVFFAVIGVFLGYALVSSLWINNREGHLTYITAIATILIFSSLLADSFLGTNKEATMRRFMYLLSFGGVLCAVANIFYWLFAIVPYGEKAKMSVGFGNSDFLAMFMFSCFCLAGNLIKGNSKTRKGIILAFMLLMGFVFIMSASILVWSAAFAFLFLCCLKKKKDNIYFTCSIITTVLFFAFAAIFGLRENDGIFYETFLYGIKSFLGKGGGYLSGKELFIGASVNYKTTGLLAYLTACSGVFGLIVAVLLILAGFINFIKLRNHSSLFSVILTALIMFLPFGSILTLLLFSGVTVYNFCLSGATVKRHINKSSESGLKRVITLLIILCFLSVTLLAGTFVRLHAHSLYQKKRVPQSIRIL